MLRVAGCALVACGLAFPAELPLLGLAHAGVQVSNMGQARTFYHDVLGLEEAFAGAAGASYFKVNDDQFIEVTPGLETQTVVPLSHLAMRTAQLTKLYQMLRERGLKPSAIRKWEDGTSRFSLQQLPGQLGFLEFVQYDKGSGPTRTKGKALGARRMGDHLQHAGFVTLDIAVARKFYVETLGFRETWSRTNAGKLVLVHLRMPGPSGDYIEIVNRAGTELTRAIGGEAGHFSFAVPDAHATHEEGLRRAPQARRQDPRFGMDERWQCNLFDQDGTRVEFMQPRDKSKTTPVPPTVVP